MGDRLNALIEVLLVFILLMTVVRLFEVLPWGKWIGYLCILALFVILIVIAIRQNDLSRYGLSQMNRDSKIKAITVFATSTFFLTIGSVWSVAVFLLLAVTGRDFSRYGLTLRSFGSDLRIVAICILPVLTVDYLPSLVFDLRQIGPWEYTFLYSVLNVVLLFVVLLLMTKVTMKENTLLIRARYIIPMAAIGSVFSIVSMIWPYAADGNTGLVLKFIDALVFGFVLQAIPQEVLFRGYIQTRLNEAFGRPYVHFGISWGAGLIIASLLFGFMHVLNTFNPFRGYYDLAIYWGIWTLFFGLIYGVMREKTGNIVAPTIVHGIEDAVYKFLL